MVRCSPIYVLYSDSTRLVLKITRYVELSFEAPEEYTRSIQILSASLEFA
jgi:hypothetical protein